MDIRLEKLHIKGGEKRPRIPIQKNQMLNDEFKNKLIL
jgi:hypothetical protein